MALLALVLAFTLGGVVPRHAAEFEGLTTQGRAVSFARRAHRVVDLRVVVVARCPLFSRVELRRFEPMAIAPDGSFGGVSRDVPRRIVPQGDFAWLTGSFTSATRARGTLVVLARSSDPSYGVTSCISRLTWTAAAR
jgi:hypothetical protein